MAALGSTNRNLAVFEREKLGLRGARAVWDEWTDAGERLSRVQFASQLSGPLGVPEGHVALGWRVVCSLEGGSPHATDSCGFAQFAAWFALPAAQRYAWFDHTEARQEELKQLANLFDVLAEDSTNLDNDAFESLQGVVAQAWADLSEPLSKFDPKTTGHNMSFADLVSLFTFEDEEKARVAAEEQKAVDGENVLRLQGYFKDLDRGDKEWAKGELLVKRDPATKTGTITFSVDGKQTWFKNFKNLYDKPQAEGYPNEFVTGIGSGGLYAFKPYPADGLDDGATFHYSLDDSDAGTKSKRAAFVGLEKRSSAGGELYGFLQPMMFG